MKHFNFYTLIACTALTLQLPSLNMQPSALAVVAPDNDDEKKDALEPATPSFHAAKRRRRDPMPLPLAVQAPADLFSKLTLSIAHDAITDPNAPISTPHVVRHATQQMDLNKKNKMKIFTFTADHKKMSADDTINPATNRPIKKVVFPITSRYPDPTDLLDPLT